MQRPELIDGSSEQHELLLRLVAWRERVAREQQRAMCPEVREELVQGHAARIGPLLEIYPDDGE